MEFMSWNCLNVLALFRLLCILQAALVQTMSTTATAASAALGGSVAATTRCRFPASWKGQYYQSGLGIVTIRDSLITTKGNCIDQSKDYYLIDNRESQCHQCLLMIGRHPNIIQYKESFCLIPDTLPRVCAQIHVETPLYTLVRDPATSVPCPFEEAYYFNYNDHQSALCSQPISYAKPCVGHTKYLLHFKHCAESAIWNGKDIDFECLATWKDGSESYLYIRLKTSVVSLKDEQYRCLKYLSYGSEVYLSMSADATCRGLRSPNDGPFIMTFIRDEFGWPSVTCLFPDWLKGITWKDLGGRRVFSFDEKGSVIQEFLRKNSSAKRLLHSETRCTKLIDGGSQPEVEVAVYSSTTRGCISKQQCLKFVKRAENIIELYQDVAMDNVAECPPRQNDKPPLVLIPEYEIVEPCLPTFGLFGFANKTGCFYQLKSICTNETKPGYELCGGDVFLECICTWKENGKIYMATKKPTASFAPIRQERCTNSEPETKANSGGSKGKVKQSKGKVRQTPTIDAALLSLTFLRLGTSDIFVNETTVNKSMLASSASTPARQDFSTTPGDDLLTSTMTLRGTSQVYAIEGKSGLDISSSSSSSISREGEAPLPHLFVEGSESSLEEDGDEFDMSSGSPRVDDEGEASNDRTTLPRGRGVRLQQAKGGGRLTNIYDSDRHPSSHAHDADFQFALINNNGDEAPPRQRHQQLQKNVPQMHNNDEAAPHSGVAGSQSPYSPGISQQSANKASSQPRSSPNCATVQLRRSLSLVTLTATVLLARSSYSFRFK